LEYNPLNPEIQANPYPAYAELRREHPATWVESLQAWAISRYEDVDRAIRNPQIFSSAGWLSQALGDLQLVPEVPWMIETDPRDHSRLRKLVSKAFTPKMVAQLEPHVRAIAGELLAKCRNAGEIDFVRDFSGVFPVIVIAEMLGVEPERRADFRRWSDSFVRATNRPSDETERKAIRSTNAEMREYFERAIADRRKHPREDLLTALVRAEEESQTLNSHEVLAMAILILLGGNETTMNLLSNTLLVLHQQPEDMAKVRDNRTMIPKLIEEALRYDSPVQVVFRGTTQAVDIADKEIPAGAPVLIMLGSANRDPEKFPDPDRFDLTRDASEHLAFGFGTHYCLGAQLARLEARVAMEELLSTSRSFIHSQPADRLGCDTRPKKSAAQI